MFCKSCGKEIADNSTICAYCGHKIVEVTVSGNCLIPANTDAVAAYYYGIFSLLSWAPVLGLLSLLSGFFAITRGHRGLKYAEANNDVGKGHAVFGLATGYPSVVIGIPCQIFYLILFFGFIC